MNDDTMGELDGKATRLGDVPKGRRSEWFTLVEGRRVRPFRFFSPAEDGNPFEIDE